ncbi:MAG: hypothetical protein A2X49_00030 [Lentisphaerae bacterium GWF2_52_8]|nr:MAG: hypothetical protein A2X49_00030 [Lentisphaerae bacterium GWF2_52_8]
MDNCKHYRAVSWWLTWKDLAWPDDDIADDIKRRADMAQKTGVNCAVIFGAHFRWDFMPLWQNLHALMAFIRNELHQRDIMLFDHHSSVLTHRYSTEDEARTMRLYNRHHLPFAPSRNIASEWTYKGKKLDDWRMIDLTSNKPAFLEQYTAEQYCMNNLDFQNAYYDYVRKLVAETKIGGLMSDDGIFYSGWTTCGCEWCRKKFKDEYGHEVPPLSDTSFWGNYNCDAFKDWIEMRFASTREFLEGVRAVVGKDFHLMSCCSDSMGHYLAKHGMTYQEFIKPCDHIMLEMCGNTPSLEGDWGGNFPVQLLHLGLGLENSAPCLGLGYGFTEASADFIWAFNKFLGSGTWFSTLKGRLGLPDSAMQELKDDTELCAHGFTWEKAHPDIFDAEADAEAAVFFSRWSRDYYSMTAADYVNDYKETCFKLLKHNITFNVVTAIPMASQYKAVLLSSTSCLDSEEYLALNKYLQEGGRIIATGPIGNYDKRGNNAINPWLKQFGISCEIDEPERAASFPPCKQQKEIIPSCHGTYQGRKICAGEWVEIDFGKGHLAWTPERMQNCSSELKISEHISTALAKKIRFPDHTCGWKFRTFKKPGSIIIHALAEKFDIGCLNELEKLRKSYRGNNIISKVTRSGKTSSMLAFKVEKNIASAILYTPLNGMQDEVPIVDKKIDIRLTNDVYYFILELIPRNN